MFILNIFKTNWYKRLSESTTSDLNNKNITDEQAKDLAAALKANRSLTSLYLPWHNIGEATFKILNEYLYRNKIITEKSRKEI
ncbi:hypothetical protein A3305_01370 [Rickettsia amblyommatis]|uniref:Uncharacterized protein n=1 Tax=Rickettsia amblyommatis (strain GAT-30V) TaxID=1105111 RepID=H8K2V9_RICAG|nr:hypothetical protein [Rickettsia amblyommatis]AFC70227.1 hypothetical protein MCE_07215 [Rickettsia amblyommatis str. GAT-30V]ALA62182.1 hypothetical protein AL573_06545 [Rickettsia amblyommatis]ARD87244.1 hypothetical protein A3305_01370 [Rickettsia amblyommatis]KJV88952.1 hypothetical protein RAMDARK_1505 [Rickettsia amblyommatis str. Darkwater]